MVHMSRRGFVMNEHNSAWKIPAYRWIECESIEEPISQSECLLSELAGPLASNIHFPNQIFLAELSKKVKHKS